MISPDFTVDDIIEVRRQLDEETKEMGTKIIPSSYPAIQHLPHSKMRDAADKSIGAQEVEWLTVKTRSPEDLVIVTEKVDGCNVGVIKQGDSLFPIIRKGYDVRTNQFDWIRDFARFVDQNEKRFLHLLSDGERVCGEWMIKTHTIQYAMPHEPFICFDLIKGLDRIPYAEACERLQGDDFVCAGLVHSGEAISTEMAITRLGSGFHGAKGAPEGVVYRYESAEHGWLFSAKFVSNPLVGDQELLQQNIENNIMNSWRGDTYP